MEDSFQPNAFQSNSFEVGSAAFNYEAFDNDAFYAEAQLVLPVGQAQAYIQKSKGVGQTQALIILQPLFWWKLNDTAAPLVDSADSTNLSVDGAPSYNETGYKAGVDGSLRFIPNSVAYNVSVPSLPLGSAARSFEFWVKTTSTANMVVLSYGASSTRQAFNIALNHDAPNQIGYWSWADDAYFTAPNLTNGAWHHVVLTYAAADTHVYVYYDGNLLGVSNLGGGLGTVFGTALRIGSNIFNGDFLTGSLDELKVYNFALTSSQVGTLYDPIYRHVASGQAIAAIKKGIFSGQAQTKIVSPSNDYQKLVFNQKPFAYFPLDETSGTTYANKWLTGDGTGLLTAPTQGVNHPLANAVGNTGVTFPSSAISKIKATLTGVPTNSGDAVTVTGWIKLGSSGIEILMWGWFVYDLSWTGSGIFGFNTGSGDHVGFDPSAYVGKWIHLAAVYHHVSNGASNKLYVNGTLLSTGGNNGSIGADFYLSGWGISDAYSAKDISQDEIALFARELTQTEIQEQYDAGIPKAYAQTQAKIGAPQGWGLAQGTIDTPGEKAGQAQATIVGRRLEYGQALALLGFTLQTAQAQVSIDTYSGHIRADSPSGYWPLSDASGTVAKALVGSDGTYKASGIIYRVSGPMAANMTGVAITATPSTYMQTNASDVTDNFSYEAWFKTSASIAIPTEANSGVYGSALDGSGNNGTPNNLWFPEQRGGSWGSGVSVGTNGIVVEGHGDFNLFPIAVYSGTISSGWHHLVIVVDSRVPKIYLDGVLVRTGLTYTTTTFRPRLLLGADSYGPFRGSVNNAALYASVLTLTQIQDHYNAGVPRGYGQASATIISPFPTGQAQAFINHIGYPSGQAQARIIAFDVPAFGQTLADISVRDISKVANAQALIKGEGLVGTVYQDVANSIDPSKIVYQFDEKGPADPNYGTTYTGQDTPNGFAANGTIALAGNFIADETGTWQFRVDVDDNADLYISGTKVVDAGWPTRFSADGTFTGSISLTAGQFYTLHVRFAQGGGPYSFRAFYKRPSETAWAYLTDNGAPWIRNPILQRFAQVQARIIGIGQGSGQAQGQLGHLQLGQAQAKINAFDVPKCGQANADIKATSNAYGQAQAQMAGKNVNAQAQGSIKAKVNSCGQAVAFIGHLKSGQAQAKLNSFDYPQWGLANADIVQTDWKFALALAAIDHGGHGQANADIKATVSQEGWALAYILPPTFWGQAQAKLNAFNIRARGQATADIFAISYPMGQAMAHIAKSQGLGLAVARILTSYVKRGQAQAIIANHQGFAQARVQIIKGIVWAQAQVQILRVNQNAYGQAVVLILRHEGYGQAQSTVLTTYYQQGYALALIDDRFAMAQAQARIKTTYFNSGQAKGLIKATLRNGGQANTWVSERSFNVGQAQVFIIAKTTRVGQAQAYINHFKWAQSQARILAFDYPRFGQAEAYIIANISVVPPVPTSSAQRFLVQYNNYTLPGYAQSEADISEIGIHTAYAPFIEKTFSEYTGLVNKGLSVRMLVWEQTYDLCKQQVRKATTFLRSAKGFEKLYLGSLNTYYLAIPTKVTVEKEVTGGSRTLEYNVEFNCKPWLYGNEVFEVSGSGSPTSLETTGRQLADGTWTPTRILVSGTDVVIIGFTDDGESTGSIHIHGEVSNLLVDTEEQTAVSNGINKNDIIINKDFGLWVGPGNTTFLISGATDVVIQYNNRWLLNGGTKVTSQQQLAVTPIEDVVIPVPPFMLDGLVYGQADAFIDNPTKGASGQARASIDSPIKSKVGLANSQIYSPLRWEFGLVQGFIRSPITREFGLTQGFIRSPITQIYGQAKAQIRNLAVRKFAQAEALIHNTITVNRKFGQANAQIRSTKQVRFAQAKAEIYAASTPPPEGGVWFSVPTALTNAIPSNATRYTGSGSLGTAMANLPAGGWLVLDYDGVRTENISVTLHDNVTIIAAAGKRPWLDGSLRIAGGNNIRLLGLSEKWTSADPSGHMFKHDGGSGEVAYGEFAYAACYTLMRPGQSIHDTRYHHLWVHDNPGISSHDGNQDHGFYCSAENPSQNLTIDHCLIENMPRGRNIKIGGPSLGNPIGGITVSKCTLKTGYGPSNGQVSNGATGIIFDRLVLIDSGASTNLTSGGGAGPDSVYTNCWGDETVGPNNSTLRDGGGNVVKSQATLLDYTANGAAGKGHLAQ